MTDIILENIYFRNIRVFNSLSEIDRNNIRETFLKYDCAIIKNALTEEIKTFLFHNITFNDHSEANNSIQFYREHHDESCASIISEFQLIIKPFYEYVLKKDLSPIVGFAMKYSSVSELKPHYDNYYQPISSTICYYNEEKISYPIYLDKATFHNPYPFRLTIDDAKGIPEDNKLTLDINEGDIGIFRGLYHLHWRDKRNIKDYRAILNHTEDFSFKNKPVSYLFNNHGGERAEIKNVQNVNHFQLNNLNNYEKFRIDYAMYFHPNEKF